MSWAARQQQAERRAKLLDHYASTAVPLDRVADHLGMTLPDVTREMRKRGRV